MHARTHSTQSLRSSRCFIVNCDDGNRFLLVQKIVQQEEPFLPSTTAMVAPLTATGSLDLVAAESVPDGAFDDFSEASTNLTGGLDAGAADC